MPALPYYLVESYIGGRCFIHHVIHQDAFFVKVNPVNLHYSIQIPLSIPRAFFQALFFNGILTVGRMIAITIFLAGDLCLPSLKLGVPLALGSSRGLIREIRCCVKSYFKSPLLDKKLLFVGKSIPTGTLKILYTIAIPVFFVAVHRITSLSVGFTIVFLTSMEFTLDFFTTTASPPPFSAVTLCQYATIFYHSLYWLTYCR